MRRVTASCRASCDHAPITASAQRQPLARQVAHEQQSPERQDHEGARPQAHRDDRRQPAPPAARPGEILRLGTMRMAPCGRILLAVVMTMIMSVMVVVRMIMIVGMIMRVVVVFVAVPVLVVI